MKKNNVGAGLVSARKERGITLIALIITIIVMLILVAVSIQIALNTGLFDSAGKATQDHKIAQEAEQELGSGKVTIDNKTYENIDDYVNEVKKKTISFTIIDEFDVEHNFKAKDGETWITWVLSLENQDDFLRMSLASGSFFNQDWNGGIPSSNDTIGSYTPALGAGSYLMNSKDGNVCWGDLITAQTYYMTKP